MFIDTDRFLEDDAVILGIGGTAYCMEAADALLENTGENIYIGRQVGHLSILFMLPLPLLP